jgi:large subunit ribosomal protein L4
MKELKKYDITGKAAGAVKVEVKEPRSKALDQTVKDYIVAVRENLRQWSASTQGRSEVNHSGKKPHKQKGTGNARQGYLGAPQYRGGGVVFGPKPKFDQKVRMNRRQKRAAVYAILSGKIESDRVVILKDPKMDAPKTKAFADFLSSIDAGRTLVLKEESTSSNYEAVREKNAVIQKSLNNIPKVELHSIGAVGGYDIAKAKTVVVLEGAEKSLVRWMETGHREVETA